MLPPLHICLGVGNENSNSETAKRPFGAGPRGVEPVAGRTFRHANPAAAPLPSLCSLPVLVPVPSNEVMKQRGAALILFVLRALQLEALLGLASDASSTPTPAELVAPVVSTLAAVYSVIVAIASR